MWSHTVSLSTPPAKMSTNPSHKEHCKFIDFPLHILISSSSSSFSPSRIGFWTTITTLLRAYVTKMFRQGLYEKMWSRDKNILWYDRYSVMHSKSVDDTLWHWRHVVHVIPCHAVNYDTRDTSWVRTRRFVKHLFCTNQRMCAMFIHKKELNSHLVTPAMLTHLCHVSSLAVPIRWVGVSLVWEVRNEMLFLGEWTRQHRLFTDGWWFKFRTSNVFLGLCRVNWTGCAESRKRIFRKCCQSLNEVVVGSSRMRTFRLYSVDYQFLVQETFIKFCI